ncbi:MAG TPA: hypothetical protein VI793_14460 [Anaerolineales bacterium]|nr:hypothetical protein [Anaerolineales bacterium]
MNKSKLVWGIICLVLAGVLAVLNLTLPPDNLMFQVGDQNMPWVPPVVLGIVGVVLLATARESEKEAAPAAQPQVVQDPEKAALNKRLETVAWGLFLIMLGGFMLVPHDVVAKGFWSIGVGVIMLGLNAARYFYNIKMSGFTTFLGVLSLAGGIAELLGMTSLEGAFLLIILGAYLILKPWFDKHQLFGKAEESRP